MEREFYKFAHTNDESAMQDGSHAGMMTVWAPVGLEAMITARTNLREHMETYRYTQHSTKAYLADPSQYPTTRAWGRTALNLARTLLTQQQFVSSGIRDLGDPRLQDVFATHWLADQQVKQNNVLFAQLGTMLRYSDDESASLFSFRDNFVEDSGMEPTAAYTQATEAHRRFEEDGYDSGYDTPEMRYGTPPRE